MATITDIPTHISPDRIVDFNCFDPPGGTADIYAAWLSLRQPGIPDIVWTPHNGGHWIALRAEDIQVIFSNYERFSSRSIIIPAGQFEHRILPQETDPPEHSHYRSIVNPWFSPKHIASLEQQARELTVSLIDGFKDNGACEFIEDFARRLPLAIAMTLLGLPMSDRTFLQKLVDTQIRHPDTDARQTAAAT